MASNPVLTLTCNCLDLTKRCVASVLAQDIPVKLLVMDNGSTDGTKEWLDSQEFESYCFLDNKGVSRGWNLGLGVLFSNPSVDHVLVIGNDTKLPSYCYSALLSIDVPFVTGADYGMQQLPDRPQVSPLTPHPDYSVFLIRREAWEKIGPFEEKCVNYCGDCDHHVRAHRLGITLWKAPVFYNHERSSTMNRAAPDIRASLHAQANADRQAFRNKWNCIPGEPAYADLFKPELFGKGL